MLEQITLGQAYSFIQQGQRGNQEDSRFPDLDTPSEETRTFLVCDGVGGQEKGEIASRTVCDAFGRYMKEFDDGSDFKAEDFEKALSYSYDALLDAMDRYSKEMATTLTFMHFDNSSAFVAHMGDSRIYQIRPDVGVMYRSNDHSLVNALVHSGNITPQEAINHPKGNYITRCMSYVEKGQDYPSAETMVIDDVEAGDYFLLCSDGVLHCIDDDGLYELFSSDISDKEKCNQLAAKCVNSPDNNTAVFVQIKSVQVQDADNGSETDEDSSTPTTEKIDYRQNRENTIVEVGPAEQESIIDKIANVLKKLF
jgi:protein phosphatase